jgi:hypothetical protein
MGETTYIIPVGAIMLCSQINNKILLYIYIYSAVIYPGFNMHIFWTKGQIISPNRHKLGCTSSKATIHGQWSWLLVSWESLGSVESHI